MNTKIVEYEASVPDTLDLAYRAKLALHGLKGTTDPENDYLMWGGVDWLNNKPYFLHTTGDVECAPKYLDDYQLMRVVSGNEDCLEYEEGLHKTLLSFIDPNDGLYYSVYSPKRPWHISSYEGAGYIPDQEDWSLLNMGAVETITLITRNDLEGGYDTIIEKMCRALVDSAIDKGSYAYYPQEFPTEDKKLPGGPYMRRRGEGWSTDHDPVEDEHAGPEGSVIAYTGHQIRALALWAERTGNEEYLEMAGKLSRGILRPCFWGNPDEPVMVKGVEHGYVDSHFHSRGQALRGILEYGITAGDEYACNFVRESCEYMRFNGINRIGWITTSPNLVLGDEKFRTMEGCFIGDLLAMYSKLTDSGYGEFFDDMDVITRNILAEAQYTNKELLQKAMDDSPFHEPRFLSNAPVTDMYPNRISYDNIAERMVGIFASNSDVTYTKYNLMQCCTCNAVRGIFYAWEAITRFDGENAVVNLLLNRASAWMDIDSYLPFEGRVALKNKTARKVSVRIPSYVNMQDVDCRRNGEAVRPYFIKRYLTIGGLTPGDVIELRFPLTTQDYTFTAYARTPYEKQYNFTMKANTVLDISPRIPDPPAAVYPYYLRDHMKTDKAPIHTVTRRIYPTIPRW